MVGRRSMKTEKKGSVSSCDRYTGENLHSQGCLVGLGPGSIFSVSFTYECLKESIGQEPRVTASNNRPKDEETERETRRS